jgi:hypothetical protein
VRLILFTLLAFAGSLEAQNIDDVNSSANQLALKLQEQYTREHLRPLAEVNPALLPKSQAKTEKEVEKEFIQANKVLLTHLKFFTAKDGTLEAQLNNLHQEEAEFDRAIRALIYYDATDP